MNTNSDRASHLSSKTLIIQPLPGIGDTFWHLKAFQAIAEKSPSKKVSILTRRRTLCDQYLHEQKWIDEILWIDDEKHLKPWGFIELTRFLKKHNFQEVWILHHSLKYYLACYLAGIPKRYGYGFNYKKFFINSPPTLSKTDYLLHNIERCHHFLKLQEIETSSDQAFVCTPVIQTEINNTLNKLPKPWIAIGFGSSDTTRIWPKENFAMLIEELLKHKQGTIFLCGSENERDLATTIKTLCAPPLHGSIQLQTNLSIYHIIHFISLCDLFIGNDSGLLNIAANVGVETVGIFKDLGAEYYSYDAFQKMLTNKKNNNLKPISEINVKEVLDKSSFIHC